MVCKVDRVSCIVQVRTNELDFFGENEFTLVERFKHVQSHFVPVNIVVVQLEGSIKLNGLLFLELVVFKLCDHLTEKLSLTG